jgi:hypothetical protein
MVNLKGNLERNEDQWLTHLDQLRRGSGLRIDQRGLWWHQETPFEHPRVIKALNKGLGWSTDQVKTSFVHPLDQWHGEATVHVGEQWCYIDCNYSPFIILKLSLSKIEDDLIATLNTEERFSLGPLTTRGEILYSRLRHDRLAKFSPAAQLQVADWLCEASDDLSGGELMLKHKTKRWLIHNERK